MMSGKSDEAASELFIGLMSGSSLDGIDAVLVDFPGPAPKLLASHYSPYPHGLAERLLHLHGAGEDELHRAAVIGNELARLYGQAVLTLLDKAGVAAESIRAIGCHGQTVRHHPAAGYTLQLGNPALLAELCNICVVADFRSRDIAAGGQGAPLVPAFHRVMFGSDKLHRVILNVGGMANITDLKPDQTITGFDTGPGNVLLDAWTQRHLDRPYDAEGKWAASGKVLPELLKALLSHPYFSSPPPKSCGREQFNLQWLAMVLQGVGADAPDVQATLLELTARSITGAIGRWTSGSPDELIVCGGGAHNGALMARLSGLLPATRVQASSAYGVDADWVEAIAFAWLARQAVTGRPGNLPAVTGSAGPRVLGAIHPR